METPIPWCPTASRAGGTKPVTMSSLCVRVFGVQCRGMDYSRLAHVHVANGLVVSLTWMTNSKPALVWSCRQPACFSHPSYQWWSCSHKALVGKFTLIYKRYVHTCINTYMYATVYCTYRHCTQSLLNNCKATLAPHACIKCNLWTCQASLAIHWNNCIQLRKTEWSGNEQNWNHRKGAF